jgi:hypothetical protein
MNNDQDNCLPSHRRVVQLDEYRRGETRKQKTDVSPKVQIEVVCNEPIRDRIKSLLAEELRRVGCAAVDHEEPGWIYSIIAFQHGESIELSIILRQFFRSTRPGTEVDRVESDGRICLRSGSWVYESLRFHGLFGVLQSELESFLADIAAEFGHQYCRRLPHRNESR